MNIDHLALDLAKESDFCFYHQIKSEIRGIYWSGFSGPPCRIHLLEHFNAMLSGRNRGIYILKGRDMQLGYLCVDKDHLNSTVEISYGVLAQYAGRGLAKTMIQLWMKKMEPDFTTVVAWIAERNIASLKTVTALGFCADDEFEYRHLAQSPSQVKFIKYTRSTAFI